MKFGVLRHMRLNEKRGFFRIESGGQPVNSNVQNALLHSRSVSIVRGQGMPISDEEETIIFLLQLDPVAQRAHVVAQVQLARGTHSARNALAWIGRNVCHGLTAALS